MEDMASILRTPVREPIAAHAISCYEHQCMNL